MAVEKLYGLIGFPLSHSFSEKYFSEKFQREGIVNCTYKLFPIEKIEDFPQLLSENPSLVGLNVTIPYKEKVLPYLSAIDDKVIEIKAVNVLKKMADGSWKGFNSDYFGFISTLLLFGDEIFWKGKNALIFGTGGSSKAVQCALSDLGVLWKSVSRMESNDSLTYQMITSKRIEETTLLVNCTPLGMYPNVSTCVPIDYQALGEDHIAIDLVYNPSETLFMKMASENGSKFINGLHMLQAQAEKAWEIWND